MNRKIKSLMVLKGITQTNIAAQLGVSRSTVACVVNGHGKSRRIQQAIADALGEKYERLWGRSLSKLI